MTLTDQTPAETAQTISEARCELTELLVDQCAHCRPQPPRAVPVVQHRFEASYRGRCAICHGDIDEGDQIGRLKDHTYACEDCCEELS